MRTPKKIALAVTGALALAAGSASAHVTYLLPAKTFEARSGTNWEYLLDGLRHGDSWAAIFLTLAAGVFAWLLYRQVAGIRAFFGRVAARADSYEPFAPWMLRLSLGVALIGAGSSGLLVSPVLTGYGALAGAQVLLGFCLMSGLLVVPAAFGALALYVVALGESWVVVGSAEYAAIAAALIILDNERPGLDDMLGLPKMSPFRALKRYAPLLLRVGLGVAMASMALYEKILNPLAGHEIVRIYKLAEIVPVAPAMWVLGAGMIELALGIAHIVGWKTRPVVGITFIVLSLSFFFFKENATMHVTLFGALSALFILNAGPWSVDAWLEKRRKPRAETCEA